MSVTEALARVSAIQSQIAALTPAPTPATTGTQSFGSVLDGQIQMGSGADTGAAASLGTPSPYDAMITQAANEAGVPPALVKAVAKAESGFDPKATSGVGAQGLMQLMPGTALRFGVRDAFDSTDNIRGGVRYYAWLLARFSGSVDLALAGFNAGEAAVERYGGIPPYAETQRYVSAVRQMIARYRLAASASGRLGDANLRQQLLEFRHT